MVEGLGEVLLKAPLGPVFAAPLGPCVYEEVRMFASKLGGSVDQRWKPCSHYEQKMWGDARSLQDWQVRSVLWVKARELYNLTRRLDHCASTGEPSSLVLV
jgi:hypothetical protein